MKSKAKQLADIFGGKWEYHAGSCGWWCNDERRSVIRTAGSMFEEDDAPCVYYLYGDGTPKIVTFGCQPFDLFRSSYNGT